MARHGGHSKPKAPQPKPQAPVLDAAALLREHEHDRLTTIALLRQAGFDVGGEKPAAAVSWLELFAALVEMAKRNSTADKNWTAAKAK